MERKISRFAAVLAVVVFSSILVLAKGAIAKEAESSVSIKGTVTAAAYDEDGKVTDVVITAGDEVYEVADDGIKDELMQFIDSEITVEGDVTEDEGIKTVKILEYRVE
jgi:hypothetical protein